MYRIFCSIGNTISEIPVVIEAGALLIVVERINILRIGEIKIGLTRRWHGNRDISAEGIAAEGIGNEQTCIISARC